MNLLFEDGAQVNMLVSIIGSVAVQMGLSWYFRWIDYREQRHFPELQLIDDESVRKQIWTAASSRSKRITIGAIFMFASIAMMAALISRLPNHLEDHPLIGGFIGYLSVAAGATLGVFAATQLVKNDAARRIRLAINAHGVPVCVTCGYNTRDLPQPRCPECGTEFQNDLCVECGGWGRVAQPVWFVGVAILLTIVSAITLLILFRLMKGSLLGAMLFCMCVLAIATAATFVVLSSRWWNNRCKECLGSGKKRKLPPLPAGCD
jgi:hypothetical protein